MAKQYQVNRQVRFVNKMIARMIRWNIAPPRTYLMTVRGRKTGKLYSTPVTLIERDEQRWLVSPYGEVNWVKNARAAGEVSLSRGGKTETCSLHELDLKESAVVVKEYLTIEGFVRPYFDGGPDSPIEAFEAEEAQRPVFRLDAK